MKFRIIEIKNPHCRPMFKPQYKQFVFWNNISDTFFARSIFNNTTFLKWDSRCVDTEVEANTVIKEFKEYLESKSAYAITHNVD
jgi:hypothetical protein